MPPLPRFSAIALSRANVQLGHICQLAATWHFVAPCNRQQTHRQRALRGLQRSVRAQQKGHVGRAQGISGGTRSPRVDSRQTFGEIQKGAAGERYEYSLIKSLTPRTAHALLQIETTKPVHVHTLREKKQKQLNVSN